MQISVYISAQHGIINPSTRRTKMPKQLYLISHPKIKNVSNQTYFFDSDLKIYYKTVQNSKNSTPQNPNVIFPEFYPNLTITKF